MAYNQVVISSGHSVNCQGMSDVINEVNEAIRVTNRVYDIIKASGKSCYRYHDTARTSSQNLANIVNFHNQYSGGVDVSVHFNACKHTNNAMGVEVCYCSQSTAGLASEMSSAIAKAGGLKNRGAKLRTGLYFLNKTKKPAILLEVCFGDSTTDCQLYRNNFEAVCQAIARTLTGASAPVVNSPAPQTNSTNNDSYKVRINADVLNVRKGPGVNYPVATTVKQNDVYTIVGEQNGFLKLKSGAGWISKNYTVRI